MALRRLVHGRTVSGTREQECRVEAEAAARRRLRGTLAMDEEQLRSLTELLLDGSSCPGGLPPALLAAIRPTP
jgi:hypothetical protein